MADEGGEAADAAASGLAALEGVEEVDAVVADEVYLELLEVSREEEREA